MSSLLSFVRRAWTVGHPPDVPKSSDAIKIGLFGASAIAPAALIIPARSHPEVIVAAVAARDVQRAKAFAAKYGIPKVHESYQDILDDSTIDAVYIPLPNSYHYEWSVKALRAGKHVLLEKPSTSNAIEARSLFSLPSLLTSPAPILLEAFHYKFHPGWQLFLSFLDPLSIASASSTLTAPAGFLKRNDIRFQYQLSGGALMDMGCYAISTLCGAFGSDPEECTSATARSVKKAGKENCDEAFSASFRFPNGAIGTVEVDLSKAKWWMPKIELPKVIVEHREIPVADNVGLQGGQSHLRTRTVTYWNFILPAFWHRIDVIDKHVIRGADGHIVRTWRSKKSKKAYTWADLQQQDTVRVCEEYWSTYRHMLEQFLNRVKGRDGSGVWVDGEESIRMMELIDGAYAKAGLPLRRTSENLVA